MIFGGGTPCVGSGSLIGGVPSVGTVTSVAVGKLVSVGGVGGVCVAVAVAVEVRLGTRVWVAVGVMEAVRVRYGVSVIVGKAVTVAVGVRVGLLGCGPRSSLSRINPAIAGYRDQNQQGHQVSNTCLTLKALQPSLLSIISRSTS